jgi:hypothetical protein
MNCCIIISFITITCNKTIVYKLGPGSILKGLAEKPPLYRWVRRYDHTDVVTQLNNTTLHTRWAPKQVLGIDVLHRYYIDVEHQYNMLYRYADHRWP